MLVMSFFVSSITVLCGRLVHVSDILLDVIFFFFKQKTAYEMRISDWSSDVCSSDLAGRSLPASSGGWLRGHQDLLSAYGVRHFRPRRSHRPPRCRSTAPWRTAWRG